MVPSQTPTRAAEEIHRFGDHPQFVQVVLPVRSFIPYGNRFYDPLYAAAVERDLVVGINFGGASGHAPTPVGWPSTYLEEHAGMAQVFQSQVISIIAEGVFDRFPELRIALIEGGFVWMPSLMWRLGQGVERVAHQHAMGQAPAFRLHSRAHARDRAACLGHRPIPVIFCRQSNRWSRTRCSCSPPTTRTGTMIVDDEAWPVTLPESVNAKIWSENARSFYRLQGDLP